MQLQYIKFRRNNLSRTWYFLFKMTTFHPLELSFVVVRLLDGEALEDTQECNKGEMHSSRALSERSLTIVGHRRQFRQTNPCYMREIGSMKWVRVIHQTTTLNHFSRQIGYWQTAPSMTLTLHSDSANLGELCLKFLFWIFFVRIIKCQGHATGLDNEVYKYPV